MCMVISMLCVKAVIVSVSLQFFSCFAVAMLAMCAALVKCGQDQKEQAGLIFLTTGSVINFVDFLTVPVITLGYPLILLLVIRSQK